MLLLAPFAPHICEELWAMMDGNDSLTHASWPTFDASMVEADTVEIAVQVNGKIRARVQVPAGASKDQTLEVAMKDSQISSQIQGKAIIKQIVVPGKLVNLVVK